MPFFSIPKILLVAAAIFLSPLVALSAVEMIPSGSKIINMGITPQTVNNAIKPYGLVYALLKANVPVKWVINPVKIKDGVDFTHNGVSYRGSAFIIPANYLTPAINTLISAWTAKGVIVNSTVSNFSVNVTYTIKAAPFWVMDSDNGLIAVNYLRMAEIPSSAYIFKRPSQLTTCDDIYVMPHADPTWNSHKNLWYWNLTYKGSIWANCNAVSILENTFGPDISNPAITRRMNFLMNDGSAGNNRQAVDFSLHQNGSPPFVSQYPAHPIMQYLGKTDNAHQWGAEQIYLPYKPGSSWRATTSIGVYDPSHADIPSRSGGQAATIAFGRAFGDPNRGYVVYESGHDVGSSTGPDNVAALRVFFNSCFLFVLDKQINVSVNGLPGVLNSGQTYANLSVSNSTLISGTSLNYQWISSCGGTFSNPTSAVTSFTAPTTSTPIDCIVTCRVTDNCGRVVFDTKPVKVVQGPRAPNCENDIGTVMKCVDNTAVVNVLANDSDPDGDPLTVTLLGNGINGTFTNLGNGNISYTPTVYFTGTDQVQYQVCDNTGLCCIANLTINVNLLDSSGCLPNQYYGIEQSITAASYQIVSGSPVNIANSLDESDGDVANSATYTNFTTSPLVINYKLSDSIPLPGALKFYVDASSNARQFTVSQSKDSVNWINSTTFSVASTDDFLESNVKAYNVNQGTRWIKFTLVSGTVSLDAMSYEIWNCIDASPQIKDDVTSTLEDIPVTIDVDANDADPQGRKFTVTGIEIQPLRGKVSINTDGTITYLNFKDSIGAGVDSFTYRACNVNGLCGFGKVKVNIIEDSCSANSYKPAGLVTYTSTLNPVADTYLAEDAAGTNYGSLTSLYVRGKINNRRRTFLRFDLSFIPPNAIIDSASLSLYHINASTSENVSIHRISAGWSETTATWSANSGSIDIWPWAVTNVGTAINTFKNWNLKSLVQNWTNGTYINNGIAFLRFSESNSNAGSTMHFASREDATASRRPKLYIRYILPAPCTGIPLLPPLAMPDTVFTNSVTPVLVNVSANDYNYNTGSLSVSLSGTTSKKGGSLTLSGNNITYTPSVVSPAFNGVDTFTYRICSGAFCDSANVFVRVTNAPPNARADFYTFQSNTPATPTSSVNNVTLNDTDPENTPLNPPVIIRDAGNGVATVSGNQITYIPNQNFIGNDTLVYQRDELSTECDAQSDTAMVIYTVTNRPPTGITYSDTTNPCEIIVMPVLNKASDPESGNLVISSISTPYHGGTAVLENNNTTIQYFPPSDSYGFWDTITYIACDPAVPSLCSSPIVVRVWLRPPPPKNTPPIAARDVFRTNKDQVLHADVLTNDIEPEGQAFITPLEIQRPPNFGSVVPLPNGLIQYTPNPGFVGVDSFQYKVWDSVNTTENYGKCNKIHSMNGMAYAFIIVQDAALANMDSVVIIRNATTSLNVVSNDIFGYDGAAAGTLNIVLPPTRGNAIVSAGVLPNQGDDNINYTPFTGYWSKDSLIYEICDASGDCDTAIVYLTIRSDSDKDGVADDVDPDDDNDGIPDVIETCGSGAAFTCVSADPSADTDNDGIVNWQDADFGALSLSGCVAALDNDNDGVPDFLDLDSDNDGIPDVVEAFGVDANGDGRIDGFTDTDSDGLSQNVDGSNTGAANSGNGLGFRDTDGDGIPNSTDLDSDNDGIPDIIEAGGVDANNNGVLDITTDSDGDGFANAVDGNADNDNIIENVNGPLIKTGTDVNNDGRADDYPNKNADFVDAPNPYDLDCDGDGLTDAAEAGFTAAVTIANGMVSGARTNGWANTVRTFAALNLRNTDGRGNADYLDIDSDDDGITDNIEGQPTSSFKVAADTDTDGDGVSDIYDISPGAYGSAGVTPYDLDADGIPDYRDSDTDNDGAPDINEASLYFNLTPSNINAADTDGDGLLDEFDPVVLSPSLGNKYINVSNSNMGSNGSYSGPVPSGSNVKLVRSLTAGDRDWRMATVLPLTILNFGGTYKNYISNLKWSVNNESDVSIYEIERSSNGTDFKSIGKVHANGSSKYGYTDSLSSYPSSIVYYRIRQVNKDGKEYLTEIITLRLDKKIINELSVFPVPFTDVLNIRLHSFMKEKAELKVVDTYGRTILVKNVQLQVGENGIDLTEVEGFLKGVYILFITTREDTWSEKIIKQ